MLLTIAIIVSSIIMGFSPVFFKKWLLVNIQPNYGSIWKCVLKLIHGAKDLWNEAWSRTSSRRFWSDLREYCLEILELVDKYVVTGAITGVLGYILLVLCFKFGQVSTIFSISSLQFVVTAALSYLYLKEELSIGEIIGMSIIIVGVSLLVPQA